MQSSEFSRPQRMDDGRYVAYCIYGGAAVDPTRSGVLNQIAASVRSEWTGWTVELKGASHDD